MTFQLTDFTELTIAILFFYVFFVSKIYLSLWAGLYQLTKLASHLIFATNSAYYKAAISVYVLLVLFGYLYKFRGVLLSNESFPKKLPIDKKQQQKIGIAILVSLIINVIAVIAASK